MKRKRKFKTMRRNRERALMQPARLERKQRMSELEALIRGVDALTQVEHVKDAPPLQ